MVKLARAAMGQDKPIRKKGPKKRFGKSRDPLKTFTAETRKRGQGGKMKGNQTAGGGDNAHKQKRRRS
ncbi:hypothetical protein CRG98_020176 [Punica granatum]|uniref:Uncharacterized protein n=1 Tax=Punica granatum TaxID=22663 RepID=A0A2I0JSX2_PUNGR|nr:hypothetical protein CRG98_020176 [Punica granatum]